MNKLLILILVILYATNGVAQSPNGSLEHTRRSVGQRPSGFALTGVLQGFEDSTRLYLDIMDDAGVGHSDSVYIIHNKFHLAGSIKEDVVYALFRTKNFSDYKFFWLENALITFTAEKHKFRQAVIKGSKTQDKQHELDSAVEASGNEKKEDIAFIQSHPNSVVSIQVLSVYASTWGKDTSAMLYRNLSDKMKNTSYGKKVQEFITLNKSINIGGRYVDFTEPDTEGNNISLSDYQGKVVLLEFWGSWCSPCRSGHPELVRTYHAFKDKGFDILGVASDEIKTDWLDAVRQDSLPWKNVCDLRGDNNRAALIYGIYKYPSNYLIDRNGIIIAQDLRGEALRKKLNEILK